MVMMPLIPPPRRALIVCGGEGVGERRQDGEIVHRQALFGAQFAQPARPHSMARSVLIRSPIQPSLRAARRSAASLSPPT